MTTKEKAAREDGLSKKRKHNNTKTNKLGKQDSMLLRFAKGKKYHRFSAEIVGDHCLPSTISDLQKKHGIYFSRKTVRVPNRFGSETAVSLYWLEGDSLQRARRICHLDEKVAA